MTTYGDMSALAAVVPTVTAAVTAGVALPDAFSAGPSKKFTAVRKLGELCRADPPPLVTFDSVMKECAFIHDALATGGKDYTNPLWHASLRAASFMEEGEKLAHVMSKGHPTYGEEETATEYERVLKDNKTKGLGWPSCATIHGSGFAGCVSCPHFNAGKSPINFGTPHQRSGAATVASANKSAVAPTVGFKTFDLPDEYEFDAEHRIVRVENIYDKQGNIIDVTRPRLFRNVISLPWAQKGPNRLLFTVNTSVGEQEPVAIETADLASTASICASLANQCVLVGKDMDKHVRDFMSSLLERLWASQTAISAVPFGWFEDKGVRSGFAYGGLLYKSDGTDQQSGIIDEHLRMAYTPKGTIDPWLDALKMITDQKRPELDTLIAASFGSPLMTFTGQSGCFLSAYSAGSGVGKSTALTVALSIWGHPKRSKEVSRSTSNSLLHKAGLLRYVPVFWDELRDVTALDNMNEVLSMLSEGVGKGRLTTNIETRERGIWNLLFICCLNRSFVDHVVQKNKMTPAGMYRVLEYRIFKPGDNDPGRLNGLDVDRALGELEHNYGNVGALYAKFLANNVRLVDKLVQTTTDDFRKRVGCLDPERFWAATAGATISGAILANQVGAKLDVDAIREHLVESFNENRGRVVEEETTGGTATNTVSRMAQFLKDHQNEQIWVDSTPSGQGAPKKTTVYHEPSEQARVQVNIRWSRNDRKLVISKQRMIDWMQEKDIAGAHILSGLKDHFSATLKDLTVGAGTRWRASKESCLVIPIPEGSPFEQNLMNWGPVTAASSTDADTGATT